MKEFSYIINDPLGIHARPAGLLVKKASTFKSDMTIAKGGKTADLKRIFGIMSLGIKQGEEITIQITGEDEETAYTAIDEFFKANL
jgi:phosphocarrier protein